MVQFIKKTQDATAGLPIVDVSGLSASSPTTRKKVGNALREACLDKGFFYCAGHGIPAGLIEAVFEETKRLFDLPAEAKAKVDKSLSTCNRGYEAIGGQTLQPGARPDRKEGFYIGLELPEDDSRVLARKFNHGPNQWPADLPGFRPAMRAYYAAMLDLSESLMRGLALSLDLDENYFAGFNRDPLGNLRLLHYPPQSAQSASDEFGAGAHTDFGGLTLLLQDDVGGLQVYDNNSDGWIEAAPIPGTFIVNLGDMIARWTNDRYRSTLHRVINRSGRERYSVPFFYPGNPDFEVACIPTCLAPGEAPKYAPIRVEDHLQEMYRRTYAAA